MKTPNKKIKSKYIEKVLNLYNSKQFKKSKKEALKLLEIDENNLELIKHVVRTSDILGELADKKKYLIKIIKLDKNNYNAYSDLSIIYNDEDNYLQAEKMCLKMLEISPDNPMSYASLAGLYSENRQTKKAIEVFEKGILEHPNDVNLKYLYSTLLLINRHYKKGFDLYRYRYHKKRHNIQTLLKFPEEALLKNLNIKDKVILFTDDQGYGDMIQFMRYLPFFEERGAKVYFKVHKLLERLFFKNYPQYAITEKDLKVDFHLPMIDAAYLFATEYNTIPFKDKYLSVDKDESKAIYDKYFKGEERKKIGIIWRSNARSGEISIREKSRENSSCSLEEFLKYFNMDKVKIYSLQHNVTEEERILLAQHNILSLGDDLVDFYDNTLRIDNLDAVIGIETASILIAGAMGKETIVLLADKPYWIWGLDGNKTEWFSSIQIVRKEKNEEWSGVLNRVSNYDFFTKGIIDSLMKTAIKYHHENSFEEAERIYNKILSMDPKNADAYHYLGLIAFQTGHSEQSVALIQQAIKLDQNLDEAYVNLKKILVSINTIV